MIGVAFPHRWHLSGIFPRNVSRVVPLRFNRKVRYPAGVDRVREFVPRHRSGPAWSPVFMSLRFDYDGNGHVDLRHTDPAGPRPDRSESDRIMDASRPAGSPPISAGRVARMRSQTAVAGGGDLPRICARKISALRGDTNGPSLRWDISRHSSS
jgi:hypothetical protein